MKKLLDELEVARDNADSIKEAQAVQLCINIVRAHNPWHGVAELPPMDERIQLAKYGIEYSISVILTDEGKVNFEVGFYNYIPKEWVLSDDANFIPAFWAFLPEVKP